MNLENRIKQMEVAACAGERCPVCASRAHMVKVYSDVLERNGIDKLPVGDTEHSECVECGALHEVNRASMSETLQRDLQRNEQSIIKKIRARQGGAELNRLIAEMHRLQEECAPQEAAFFGESYPLIKRAEEAAHRALEQWVDERRAEWKKMLSRAPLIERRKFGVQSR